MDTPTGGTDVIAALIRGLVDSAAAVDAARAVIKRNDDARAQLRDTMIEARLKETVDEDSGYKAVLKQNERDVYVAEKLVPLLRPEEINDVIQTIVDGKEVQKLVDAGVVTRVQLIREGALVREASTRPFILLVQLKGARP